jgi:hypothetical protein
MLPFTKREQILIIIIAILTLLAIFLSIKIADYKIGVFSTSANKYNNPPSLEESIENASMIFLCKKEIHGKVIKYMIDRIIYKDDNYTFPYEVGNYFPRLQQYVEEDIYDGEGQVVILSSKSNVPFQSALIIQGVLRGFNNIKVEDFIKKIQAMKH